MRSLMILPLVTLFGCMDNEIHPIKDGSGGASPEISVDPASVVWGYIEPSGQSSSTVITFESTGDENLTVSDIKITDDGGGAFTMTDVIGLGEYPPGTSSDFVVVYTATGIQVNGTVSIESDDPDSPILDVPLSADGEVGHDTDTDTSTPLSAPVAVCSVNPSSIEAIHDTAAWIGDSSYDTDGGSIVSWTWTLISAPSGATASMPPGGANRSGFTPDIAGDYTARLVVTDDSGLSSDPCDVTLTATAGEGLWVETYWTHMGDDMDLHLLKSSASIESSGDCYYANCVGSGLDWGVRGDRTDNPSLDLDDIPGTGPENINIESPANDNYTVIVRDYPGSVYNGRNDVTVNIYVGGVLVWYETRNINSEGCYEKFASVTIPGGVVSSLPSVCY